MGQIINKKVRGDRTVQRTEKKKCHGKTLDRGQRIIRREILYGLLGN